MEKDLHPPADARATVAAMRACIDAASEGLLDPAARSALLGVPASGATCDDANYLGELAWLRQRGGILAHVGPAGPTNWLRMERRIGDGAILLHGGGSFGDTEPDAQAFREAVLWRYRGRPVIQLPQMLRFTTGAAIDQAARVIERHGAFTLLVGDRASHDLATSRFACDVRLCPPMAFALGPLPHGVPSRPLLMLLADAGQQDGRAAPNNGVPVERTAEPAGFLRTLIWRERRAAVAALLQGEQGPVAAMWRIRAEARVHRALAPLREAGFVITDRLDVHILCVLLDVPHCAVGGDDSPLGRFLATWQADDPATLRAHSADEARALYRARRGAG